MNLYITGKGIKVGENLNEYIHNVVEINVKKFFENALSAKITVHKESYLYHVDIVVNEGVSGGEFIKVSGIDKAPYTAVDIAITHLVNKLKKYKERIKHHKHSDDAKISSHLYRASDDQVLNGSVGVKFHKMEEQLINLRTLSIEDAIMHVDLIPVPALPFINIETNTVNILYTKDDGTIVVLDTQKVVRD